MVLAHRFCTYISNRWLFHQKVIEWKIDTNLYKSPINLDDFLHLLTWLIEFPLKPYTHWTHSEIVVRSPVLGNHFAPPESRCWINLYQRFLCGKSLNTWINVYPEIGNQDPGNRESLKNGSANQDPATLFCRLDFQHIFFMKLYQFR